MMVKKNHPNTYVEISRQFNAIKADRERMKTDPAYYTIYPEHMEKDDEVTYSEKNRDRYEYRVANDALFVLRTEKQWSFLKSVGYVEQVRIMVVRDEEGNDITPIKEKFLLAGSPRRPVPEKGDVKRMTSRWSVSSPISR